MERRLDCLRTGVGVLAGGTSMRSSFWLVLGVDGTDEEQSLKLPPPLLACNEGKARLREGRAAGPVPPAGRGGRRRVRELRPRDANATGRRLLALLATPAPAARPRSVTPRPSPSFRSRKVTTERPVSHI